MDILPFELVVQILNFVVSDSWLQKRNMFRLRLVSKTFCRALACVATPFFRVQFSELQEKLRNNYKTQIKGDANVTINNTVQNTGLEMIANNALLKLCILPIDESLQTNTLPAQDLLQLLPPKVSHLSIDGFGYSWSPSYEENIQARNSLFEDWISRTRQLKTLDISYGKAAFFQQPRIAKIVAGLYHLTSFSLSARDFSLTNGVLLGALSNATRLERLQIKGVFRVPVFEHLHKFRALKHCDIQIHISDEENNNVLGSLFRGLTRLSSLTLTLQGTRQDLTQLFRELPNLQTFVFCGTFEKDTFSNITRYARMLTRLEIKTDEKNLIFLDEMLFSFSRLKTLVLGDYIFPNDFVGEEPNSPIPKHPLQTLELSISFFCNFWKMASMLSVCALRLKVSSDPFQVSLENHKTLEGIGRLKSLEELQIDSNLMFGQRGAGVVSTLQHLKSLRIGEKNNIGDEGARCLSMLPHLEVLHVDESNEITNVGVESITRIRTLKELDLMGIVVNTNNLHWFSCITRLVNLEYLFLWKFWIGKLGFRFLSALPRLLSLEIGQNADLASDGAEEFLKFLARPDETHVLEYMGICIKGNGLEDTALQSQCRALASTRKYELDIDS